MGAVSAVSGCDALAQYLTTRIAEEMFGHRFDQRKEYDSAFQEFRRAA
jgi:hypothetical protein